MRIKYLQLFLSSLFLLGGCTMQSWYEGMKMRAENECRMQQPGATEDCLARVNHKTYDDYEKERSAE